MKPTLGSFELGGAVIPVPTYGVLVMLGFALGIALVVHDGRKKALPPDALLDLSWWILVTGLLGSRIFFVVQNVGHFAARWRAGDRTAALRLWDGGLVFYGGAIAAGAFVVWFARRRGWRFLLLADLFAPGVVLGHAIGRLGCYAAGCCFGHPCALADGQASAWCVQFPAGSVAHAALAHDAALTPPLLPTQLFESAALFALFVFLRLARRRLGPNALPGQIFLLYLTGYATLRFGLELFRGDLARHFVFEAHLPGLARVLGLPAAAPLFLSTSQAVSLVMLAGGVAGLLALHRQFLLARS